jgi:hypothetical protein
MASDEQPSVPIWAEAKAKRQVDVLKEVAKVVKCIEESERVRANQPIGSMTESELEAEQLRLQELLRVGTLTVDGFRRLREVDFYLEGMRRRREYDSASEGWEPEILSDD